jgi:hypothetical protein
MWRHVFALLGVLAAGIVMPLLWTDDQPTKRLLSAGDVEQRLLRHPVGLPANGRPTSASCKLARNEKYLCTVSFAGSGQDIATSFGYDIQVDAYEVPPRQREAELRPPSWTANLDGTKGSIYWAQSPTGASSERGSIARGTLDGSNVKSHFIDTTKGGGGVAVEAQHIFWANYATGTIGRAKLDGSHVDERFITGAQQPIGLAADSHYIYWTNPGDGTIGRATLDGSHVNQRFIRTTTEPASAVDGLAVDGRHIYWAEKLSDRIGRANLDGTGVDDRFITGANSPDGAAVDGQHIYWSNGGDDTIGRASLDGSGVNQRCVAPKKLPIGNVPEGVATDGQHVYWSNYPANTIGRANADGTSVDGHFIVAKGVPEGIAIDATPPLGPSLAAQTGCAPSKPRILLGLKRYMRSAYAAGWGEAAPTTISNGGASASGTISDIHWRSWGGRVAVGRGLNPLFKPHGGYYRRPGVIELHVSAVKRCSPGGPRVYTRLAVRQPSRPGGPFGRWGFWAPNMCARH